MSYSYDADYDDDHYGGHSDGFAADAALAERVSFIRRTYAHLFGAIMLFLALITVVLTVEPVKATLFGIIGGNWWICFILYYVASMVAQKFAQSDSSVGLQYAGLALFTVAEALIFVPLLVMAETIGGGQIIPMAGFLTLTIFGGLTAIVFLTKQDFSFLRMALSLGSLAVFAVMIASFFIDGFSPNFMLYLVVGLIVLMSGYILYDTSNVLHHYRTDQHVAASLALFSSVATLFYYVIFLLTLLSGGDD